MFLYGEQRLETRYRSKRIVNALELKVLLTSMRFDSSLVTMKEIIYNGDKAYQLVRVLTESQLKNPDTSLLKKWFMCDTLLRNQGKLYFCRIIEDIEYEEINI